MEIGITPANEQSPPDGARGPRRWLAATQREVRSRPFGYGVLAAFVVAGPVVGRLVFPEAPIGVGFAGGLFLGIWAALCAVPEKFL